LKLDKNSNVKTFSINLATEKELAETKITTGELSTELKSKFYVESKIERVMVFHLILFS
jgi:hypothetical protein